MTGPSHDARTPRGGLRLWPGVALVTTQWLLRFGAPLVAPEGMVIGLLGAVACGLGVLLWWLLFSRAPWRERLGALAVLALVLAATPPLLHPSIAGGMMGMMFYLSVVPFLSLALVAWAAFGRELAPAPRWAALAAGAVLACGAWTLLRTEGITGDGRSDLEWRWTASREEQVLASTAMAAATATSQAAPGPPGAAEAAAPIATEAEREAAESSAAPEPSGDTLLREPGGAAAASPAAGTEPATISAAAGAAAPPGTPPEWPGFRGPARDGAVRRAPRLATAWSATPPAELWRRPIGPGWGSFAVHGDRLYTQEQRGEEEVVSCYRLATGEPVWSHHDPVRFWESNAGAGPRATPTLAGGRVYAFGATGILNALAAADGALLWSRDVAADTGREVPGWGFASSPLVVGDTVLVAAAGDLAAYDAATGEPRWFGRDGGGGYSSPHLATLDGVTQVVLMRGPGTAAFDPADGRQLWLHSMESGTRIVQPALTPDGDLLLADGDGQGLHRVAVARRDGRWAAEERWSSIGLKPYFNDFVVHGAHAYGFDGNMLASVDLATGKRAWKGGRYGHGQLVLLPEQDLLLVISEAGELALVAARAEGFAELARAPAIAGKTWNHPVLVGDVLLVRNGEEMAAFRLPIEPGAAAAAASASGVAASP